MIDDAEAFCRLSFDFAYRGLRGLSGTSAHERAVDNLSGDDNAEDQCATKRQPERVRDVYVSAQRDARPRLGQQGNPLVYRQRGQKDDEYYMGVRGVELDPI